MTEATLKRASDRVQSLPTLEYQVAMPQPESHLFEVTLNITSWQSSVLDLKMPVWTPGSYLVREYARHVQEFWVEEIGTAQVLPHQKVAKNHWQIQTQDASEIAVHYRVFANELTVRTNHLDSTHGYFNGAALFYFVPTLEKSPIRIQIIPPNPQWQVTTTLPSISGEINCFEAIDFDTLVDSPFEIGTQRIYDFEVFGKSHQLAIWGQGNANPTQIMADIAKIIEVEARLYNGLPYQQYLFLLHLSASGFGGLEHKDSCSLNYPRFHFREKNKYNRFMQLVAHEFFHLWNVKRIRPQALEIFDYEQENYTPSLWFCEGTTSYYDCLIPLWAGIYNREDFFKLLGKEITLFLNKPGRKVHPVSEASFDAWIKLYRRDANSDNCQISYYLKGEMVSLLLDLLIRSRHQNQRSLNDVMVQLWEKFGKAEIGFTPQQLQETIESVADLDLDDFFQRYVQGTNELPFNEYLQPFGLELLPIHEKKAVPHLGIKVKTEQGKTIVQFVEANSPAALGGINTGDELLALDGFRITQEEIGTTEGSRLGDYQPGDKIQATIFHQDQLRTLEIILAEPHPTQFQVVRVKSASSSQQNLLQGWLQLKSG